MNDLKKNMGKWWESLAGRGQRRGWCRWEAEGRGGAVPGQDWAGSSLDPGKGEAQAGVCVGRGAAGIKTPEKPGVGNWSFLLPRVFLL